MPDELASVVKMYRESRQWSQEQLAGIAGLSTRTIQRVENGRPSNLDTRRALARAFAFEDIDVLNKPFVIPTPAEMEAARVSFEREHITLDVQPLIEGRHLADLAETHSLDLCMPGFEMDREPAEAFAALVDYFHEYRDCADQYSEMQKLDVHRALQAYIDELTHLGISLRHATRKVALAIHRDPGAKPLEAAVLYLIGYPLGKEPARFNTPRRFRLN